MTLLARHVRFAICAALGLACLLLFAFAMLGLRRAVGDTAWLAVAQWVALVVACLSGLVAIWALRSPSPAEFARDALRASELRFRSLVHATAAVVLHADPEGMVTRAHGWMSFTGTAPEVALGRGWLDAVHPDDRRACDREFYQALTSAQTSAFEFRMATAAHGWRYVAARVVPVVGKDGQIIEWIGMVRDVHHRRVTEHRLIAREQELRLLLQNTPAGIAYFDTALQLRWSNAAFKDWLGLPGSADSEELARLCTTYCPQGLQAELRRAAGGMPIETELAHFDIHGHRHWTWVRATPDLDVANQVIGCIVVCADTTQRRETEDALKLSELEHRTLTETVPQMVWIVDERGNTVFCNQRWYDYTGLEPGQGPLEVVHPEDAPGMTSAWRAAFRRGDELQFEARYRRAADKRYRWHMVRGVPLRDAHGQIRRWYGTCTDIHDQRLAQELLQDSARRQMEFLATLSHELRNPLAALAAASDVLREHGVDAPTRERAGATIARQSGRLARMVDDLLDLARVTHGKIDLRRRPRDVAAQLREIVTDLAPRLVARGVELRAEVPGEPIVAEIDADRFQQMIENLVVNAARHSTRGQAVRVALTAESPYTLRIDVIDHGAGMSAEVIKRIFEPFVQAHERGSEGLGLGLTVVRSLAEMHDGSVQAHSEGLDQGATFTLILPRTDLPAEAGEPALAPIVHQAAPATANTRVLVIEDDVDAGEMLRTLLQLHQYEVRLALDAREGLKLAREFSPAVIVCDLGLPGGVSGFDVARAIHEQYGERRPYLIAFSGWGHAADRARADQVGFDAHLLKPGRADQVLGCIAQGLGRRDRRALTGHAA